MTRSSASSATDTPKPSVPWSRYAGVYVLLFLIGTETFLVAPILPAMGQSLGVSAAAAATSVTAYTLAYAISAPFLGVVTDRYGRYPMIMIGAGLFLVGNVFVALSPVLSLVNVARIIGALGAACAGPAIWAHLAETAHEQVRGRAVGTGNALFAAGQVVGVPVGSLLTSLGTWRTSFLLLAVLTAVVLPVLYMRTRPTARLAPHDPQPLSLRGIFTVWRDPVLRHVLVVVVLLHAANLGTYTFLGVILNQRFGLGVDFLGLIGVFVGVGSALGSVTAGRIGDRARRSGRGDARWIPIWCLVLAVGVALTVTGSPPPVSYVAALVWFFASGAFVTVVQTLLLDRRPELGASSSSWNTSLLYAGTAVGVTAIGSVGDVETGALVIGTGLAVLAALVAAPLARRSQPEPAREHTTSSATGD